MNKLYSLLTVCYHHGYEPEGLLGLGEQRRLPQGPLPPLHELYEGAIHERLKKVLDLYIRLRGVQAGSVVSDILLDIIKGKESYCPIDPSGMRPYEQIVREGISLTWWLFGLGKPIMHDPVVQQFEAGTPLRDVARAMRAKQDWTELEGTWMMTQTHCFAKNKLAHKIICRIVAGLPPLRFFPEMPPIMDIYRRMEDAVRRFTLPPHAESWMRDTVIILKESLWRSCVLMLVRQGSVSHWNTIRQQPRRKTERLAFVITVLFTLYGEQEGLEYYLRVLNEEAKAQGFLNLSEVVRGAQWNNHLPPR